MTETKKSKKKKGSGVNWLRWIVIVFLIAILAYGLWGVWTGFKKDMTIITQNAEELCENEACVQVEAWSEENWIEWQVQPGWPLGFSISADESGEEKKDVTLVCPIDLKNNFGDHLWSKLSFIMNTDRLAECEVKQ